MLSSGILPSVSDDVLSATVPVPAVSCVLLVSSDVLPHPVNNMDTVTVIHINTAKNFLMIIPPVFFYVKGFLPISPVFCFFCYLGSSLPLWSLVDKNTTSRKITAFTICPIPEFKLNIIIIWLKKVMEKAPMTAA